MVGGKQTSLCILLRLHRTNLLCTIVNCQVLATETTHIHSGMIALNLNYNKKGNMQHHRRA